MRVLLKERAFVWDNDGILGENEFRLIELLMEGIMGREWTEGFFRLGLNECFLLSS